MDFDLEHKLLIVGGVSDRAADPVAGVGYCKIMPTEGGGVRVRMVSWRSKDKAY